MTMLPPSNNTTASYPPLEDGLQKARCYMMAYVGTHEDDYKVWLIYALKSCLASSTLNTPMISKAKAFRSPTANRKPYTFNLGRKANLRKDLEGWRGTKWTEDWPEFDITKVIGTAVLHNITHSEDGSRFYIENYIKVKKQSDVPPLTIEPICYDIRNHDEDAFQRLPKWVREMVETSQERANQSPPAMQSQPPATNQAAAPDPIEQANAEMSYSGPSEEQEDVPF